MFPIDRITNSSCIDHIVISIEYQKDITCARQRSTVTHQHLSPSSRQCYQGGPRGPWLLFSRTIDPFAGTFAINELLPARAATVQLPSYDTFPRGVRDLFSPRLTTLSWVKSWTWAQRGGNTWWTVLWLLHPNGQRYTRTHWGIVSTGWICEWSILHACLMLILRGEARE